MSQIEPSDWRTHAADLFVHHEEVLEGLARRNPAVDFADLHDAFVKTILEIAADPAKFDSSRGSSLPSFLAGATQQTLRTIRRSNRRRQAREEKSGRVVAKRQSAARTPLEKLADAELAEQAMRVAETDSERNVLQLWSAGNSDAEIAAQLDLDPVECKRIRDRLTKRLGRLKQRFDGSEP